MMSRMGRIMVIMALAAAGFWLATRSVNPAAESPPA